VQNTETMKKLLAALAILVIPVTLSGRKMRFKFPRPLIVTATMYKPVRAQCDADPLVTAGMYRINPKKHRNWIAASRDMLRRWGGKIHYGDRVMIVGAGHKDGIYTVVDAMNKRFRLCIDFLEVGSVKPYKFENVKLYKL